MKQETLTGAASGVAWAVGCSEAFPRAVAAWRVCRAGGAGGRGGGGRTEGRCRPSAPSAAGACVCGGGGVAGVDGPAHQQGHPWSWRSWPWGGGRRRPCRAGGGGGGGGVGGGGGDALARAATEVCVGAVALQVWPLVVPLHVPPRCWPSAHFVLAHLRQKKPPDSPEHVPLRCLPGPQPSCHRVRRFFLEPLCLSWAVSEPGFPQGVSITSLTRRWQTEMAE